MDTGQQGAISKQIGANVSMSLGEFGDQLCGDLMPRYYQNTLRGNTFGVTYPAAALVAASATATGAFALFNPLNSGKNLVIVDAVIGVVSFTAAITDIQAALQGWTYTPTSIGAGTTPSCMLIGSGCTSMAKTYVSGTLVGAPTATFRHLANFYIDLAAGDMVGSIKDEIAGAVIITPGSGISVVGIATIPTHTVTVSFTWMETVI